MDKIILTGISVFGHHGCGAEEQEHGQIFKVDVTLNLDLSKSGKTDNISETVDYAQVLFIVENIVAGTPRKLIETVAEEIADTLLKRFSLIESLKIVLHKPDAPLPIKYADAAVEITRSRND